MIEVHAAVDDADPNPFTGGAGVRGLVGVDQGHVPLALGQLAVRSLVHHEPR